MPGPAPKPSEARKRRNKKATAALLVADPDAVVPPLPAPPVDAMGIQQWEPAALDFWNELWTSPMASQWTEVDAHGLYAITILVHAFHRATTADEKRQLHAEIRIARRDFGLTPMSRASLHWQVAESARAVEKARKEVRPRADAETELSALGP